MDGFVIRERMLYVMEWMDWMDWIVFIVFVCVIYFGKIFFLIK